MMVFYASSRSLRLRVHLDHASTSKSRPAARHRLRRMFYWPAFFDAFPALWPGLLVTIELTVLVMPCALDRCVDPGTGTTSMHRVRPRARIATMDGVEFWRATPLLLPATILAILP